MNALLGQAWRCPRSAVLVTRRFRSKPSKPPKKAVTRGSAVNKSFNDLPADEQLRRRLSDRERAQRRTTSSEPALRQRYDEFYDLTRHRLNTLLRDLGQWNPEHREYRAFGLHSQEAFIQEISLFKDALKKSFGLASTLSLTARSDNPLFWNLRAAFIKGDAQGLTKELRYALQTFLMRKNFSKSTTALHLQLADLRFPYEWFPATRQLQRTIHLHVGPTNSGKTYNALKALENAKSGIYAGPLRLLAHEIYTRFIAKGKRCALITGEEQRIPEDADMYFRSCTVEMTPLNWKVDVAVIDEIQMIADEHRGWAWTQAVLGCQAKELHLCGEERVVDLIQELCARLGDKCIVHRYVRLNPLLPMEKAVGDDFKNLQKGDAVIAFSRVNLHALKAGIESATGRKCAIVYGSLPPETRAAQAALFNDPNNDYDFLVASDAIGMGLNLEIKRVVFESAFKFDGSTQRPLTIPEVKQIAGRAGRYRTANDAARSGEEDETSVTSTRSKWGAPGFVTAMDGQDLEHITKHLLKDANPITAAGIMPPSHIIERFAFQFSSDIPLGFVLSRLREMARLSSSFNMCSFGDPLDVAEVIKEFKLSIYDRSVLLTAPVALREEAQKDILRAFAWSIANLSGGHLLEIPEIDLEVLDVDPSALNVVKRKDYLVRLEGLHKAITLYLWLSYRYRGVFISQNLAFHVKTLVEEKITNCLESADFDADKQQKRRELLRRQAQSHTKKEEKLLGEVVEDAPVAESGPGLWEAEGHEDPLYRDEKEVNAALPVRVRRISASPKGVVSQE
ncbi:P-loop containing nucleoside triphosphate hydrolase protein [Pseudoneurospora amorphoporcata]|uniref:RNA helicase n=1 Tax=Pseudoneurospora amorphoporcata TaxID=241081 RepID=A0AAN6SEK6_9PEZI|nr:P-loop containing nucleoside triphosphate hydrolase protein [Pseudoneurospora amorphoporcata]